MRTHPKRSVFVAEGSSEDFAIILKNIPGNPTQRFRQLVFPGDIFCFYFPVFIFLFLFFFPYFFFLFQLNPYYKTASTRHLVYSDLGARITSSGVPDSTTFPSYSTSTLSQNI